ncbi:MAG: hypothetical protein ACTS2F_29690 [Thainema sp.]
MTNLLNFTPAGCSQKVSQKATIDCGVNQVHTMPILRFARQNLEG